MNATDMCRTNGWNVGDSLDGDEGHGPTRIKIAAIGEELILARQTHQNGAPWDGYESLWTLAYRDWKKVNG
jgi:hypothetical protein